MMPMIEPYIWSDTRERESLDAFAKELGMPEKQKPSFFDERTYTQRAQPWNRSPTSRKLDVFEMSDNLSEMKEKLRASEQMYDGAMTALEKASEVAHRQQREIEESRERPTGEMCVFNLLYDRDGCHTCDGWDICIMPIGTRYRARMRFVADPSISFFLTAEEPTEENTKKLVEKFLNQCILKNPKGKRHERTSNNRL